MDTGARRRWRAAIEEWVLPQALVEAGAARSREPLVDEKRTPHPITTDDDSETVLLVEELGGAGASVLDIGAGAGRLAIPLASRGHRVTTVERDETAARVLGEEAERARVRITRIVGSWPQVAGNAGRHDVVLSAHVVYSVADIGPFVEAMDHAERRAVVVEMTPRHPWSHLNKYFRALHDLERPRRPTVEDFAAVVEEVVGQTPERRWWSAPVTTRFADLAELLAHYRRRLLVTPERSVEASGLLEPDVVRTDDGWLVLGDTEREMVTLWWRTRQQ